MTMFWKSYLFTLLIGTIAASEPEQIVPGAFIVEYENIAEASSVIDQVGAIKTMDLNFELFRGASIQFSNKKSTKERVSQLLAMPAIKNVWPKKLYPAPDDLVHYVASAGSAFNQVVRRSKFNDTVSIHVQTQVDRIRAKGFTGEGVKIAVIDTGIDYTHNALGGCFGSPNCLVVIGYDLVGDKYNGSNTPVPDNDPLDTCRGHGTHVAGIIAAQPNEFGFTGAAPGVKLAAYRVFGCTGSAATDVLIASFMRAYQDGANIITASIGGSSGWSEDAAGVILSRLMEKGIIVTVAAGNAGNDGLFFGSDPAGGKGVAAIASFDNTLQPMLLVTSRYAVADSTEQQFDYSIGTPRKWAGVKLRVWALSFDTTQIDQGCSPFPTNTPNLSDKIVLIRRRTCSFQTKAQNAVARGARYIMFYNNIAGNSFIGLDASQNLMAVGMVSATLGVTWVNDLAAGKTVTLDMADSPTRLEQSQNNQTGGFLSSYTTWGPSFEGDVKPIFGTPGGNILSTYPIALGSYAVLSGTSMATPLAAAIYALISNVRRTLDPFELQNVLAATAKPVQHNEAGVVRPLLAAIPQQGAGMIQAYDAAYATTVLSTSSLAFNDTIGLTEKNFTISNTGDKAVTYELDIVSAATAYTFSDSKRPDNFPELELDNSFAVLHLSEHKVTIPAGDKCTITVKATPPSVNAARLPVYGGYIKLNGTNGERLSLPYQGIAGNLNTLSVQNTTYVSRSAASPDYAPVTGSNSTFLFPRINITNITDDLPVAVIDMLFGSPLVNVEILSTSNYTNNLGHALNSPLQWVPRELIPFWWNGQLADKSFVPAGNYKFRISALHVFGDASDEKQYEVAESSIFTIKYK